MAYGNWKQQSSGDELTDSGRHAIIARNNAILEVSIDGVAWEAIHTFPPSTGEFFIVDLPTETGLRVSGGGQWAIAKYNEMSG